MAKSPSKTSSVPAFVATTEPLPQPAKQSAAPEAKRLPVGSRYFMKQGFRDVFFEVTIPRHHGEVFLDPYYWTHHAKKISVNAILICVDELRRYEVWLRVVDKADAYLRVVQLFRADYEFEAISSPEIENKRKEFRLEHIDQQGWRVVNRDNKILIEGLLSEQEARDHLSRHLEMLYPKKAA